MAARASNMQQFRRLYSRAENMIVLAKEQYKAASYNMDIIKTPRDAHSQRHGCSIGSPTGFIVITHVSIAITWLKHSEVTIEI
jgi:hypothetical protein